MFPLISHELIHAYRLAVLTGLRPGELRGLRWQDVKRDRLELHQSTNCYNEITDGKNQNARRCVELSDLARMELEAQRRGKHRIGCIGTAFEEFKRVGADLYKEALSLIVAAWQLSRPHPVDETGRRSWRRAPVFARELRRPPQKSAKRKRDGDPESLRAETIQSVTRFIELYRQEYDPRRLVSRLHKTDPLTIYREGRAMGVNMAGYKKYLYQVFCICKKKVLPMKF